MKNLVRTAVLAALLLTGESVASAQVSFGIQIGPPPRPRVMHVMPRQPGPYYVWIEGYWYPVGNHYKWHDGYWTRPPYPGARWFGPRYDRGMYLEGYWESDHARFKHDHKWDRDHNHRDYRYDDHDNRR